jgi:hypothetical protein
MHEKMYERGRSLELWGGHRAVIPGLGSIHPVRDGKTQLFFFLEGGFGNAALECLASKSAKVGGHRRGIGTATTFDGRTIVTEDTNTPANTNTPAKRRR